MADELKLVADFTIFPEGIGASVGDYVRKAYLAMKQVEGVELQPGPMSTVLEADSLDKILEVVTRGHQALLEAGVPRIYMILRVDDRRDKPQTAAHKLERIAG